jgi:tRNA uridine 5-carbamoylmethylation protein Kti12
VGAGFIQLYVSLPLEEVLKRNEKRQNSVDEKIVRKMFNDFEIPNPIQNKWELHSITIDALTLFSSHSAFE